MKSLEAICYSNFTLKILNQLLLPSEIVYEDCSTSEKAFHAIKLMKVRGAPAIAITAALALSCEAYSLSFSNSKEFAEFILSKLNYLCQSRPTAVNLFHMADSAKHLINRCMQENASLKTTQETFYSFAKNLFIKDIETNKAIGFHGLKAIKSFKNKNIKILTHCNTGSLATAGYGTALGVIRALHAENCLEKVFATETRPYNQGSRLTAFELVHEKIPATLITDSMASFAMKTFGIDAVIVGADRVAANGDTANKIGTYQLAVAANFHKIPFFVASPSTSIDLKTQKGEDIHIEQRPKIEMISLNEKLLAPMEIDGWNPSFDVTPHKLISGIITEYGVIYPDSHNSFNMTSFLKNGENFS